MHELSVCARLVERVAALARERGARRVTRVAVRIGPLAGVEPALLAHAWPHAARGSVAEGARLEVERCALRVACLACGAESAARADDLRCGACGAASTRLAGGAECLLVGIVMGEA